MKNKITFKELANLSGVSIGTLSRFFNNGSVSAKNRKIIQNNIDKYEFVKNSAAARVRGENNQLIILRTVVSSNALDTIISGIIENISNDVMVKYGGSTEEQVIKSIEVAITDAPKYLIVFAPTNATSKFDNAIKKASKYSKVVVYNYNTIHASCVTTSYEDAIKSLSLKYKRINFVYDDVDDIATFKNRINSLENTGIKLNLSKDISSEEINFYQSKHLYTKISFSKPADSILISYTEPIKYSNKVEWIFVDQYRIGVLIAKLCISNTLKHEVVNAEHIKKQQ
ncbi:LacI family DNA-binding transcriptional regulator [Mycoplasma todarodis]|nr:LacI family DNA-binding transcriptional regulator [Mycoplasma todarodis]